ncbi:MAG: DUF983 domain-containing protein [Caulobacteraceae bacterium]
MDEMVPWSKRSFHRSLARGLRMRCPHCGAGKMFYRYLKVEPVCQTCGCDLDKYPSDDGPAYFTVLLVGHLVVVPFLIVFAKVIWKAPLDILIPSALAGVGAITLLALPVIKGAVVGALYALDITRADGRMHTADAP